MGDDVRLHLSQADLERFLVVTMVEFAAAEQTLNSLNVYPVPDGDTGSNLRGTWASIFAPEQAVSNEKEDKERGQKPPSAQTDEERLRGALRRLTAGARGNSGVILSEYVRGCAKLLTFSDGTMVPIATDQIVHMLHAGAAAARQSVAEPSEGTVLSVADAAAVGAVGARSRIRRSGGDPSPAEVLQAAVQEATEVLKRSPQQLAVLASAGVVDAGGAGLLFLLESLARVAGGRDGLPRGKDRSWLTVAPTHAFAVDEVCQVARGGPAFELMAVAEGLDEESAEAMRHALADCGDSVVVAGGGGLYRVHVHTDDVLGCASVVRSRARLTAPAVTRFAGVLAGLADIEADVEDEVLRSYARSWGFTVRAEGVPAAPLVVADGRRPSVRTARRLGTRSTVQAVATIDACAFAALVEEEPDFAREAEAAAFRHVLQADSWRAAHELLDRRMGGVEQVVVLIDPEAEVDEVDRFVTRLTVSGVDSAVLRLTTGVLVQLGVE